MRVVRPLAFLFAALPLVVVAKGPLDTRQARQTVTMEYLMESCTVVGETAGGMVPHFDCESFLYGILDAYVAMRGALKSPSACFPADIAPWQVYEQLADLPRTEDWGKPAAPLILDALGKRYPCK